jgi:hypothetical protein
LVQLPGSRVGWNDHRKSRISVVHGCRSIGPWEHPF